MLGTSSSSSTIVVTSPYAQVCGRATTPCPRNPKPLTLNPKPYSQVWAGYDYPTILAVGSVETLVLFVRLVFFASMTDSMGSLMRMVIEIMKDMRCVARRGCTHAWSWHARAIMQWGWRMATGIRMVHWGNGGRGGLC